MSLYKTQKNLVMEYGVFLFAQKYEMLPYERQA